MRFGYRPLVLAALLVAAAASGAEAQRGVDRPKRPPYGYFKYRIPRITTPIAPRLQLRDGLSLRAMERARGRLDQMRERQFALQDRARTRHFELQDRAWRRQLEARERAFSRMYDRLDRLPKLRSFSYRRHWRTI